MTRRPLRNALFALGLCILAACVVNLSRPVSRFSVSNSCRPGSWMVGLPSERLATISGSLSIAVTVWPS